MNDNNSSNNSRDQEARERRSGGDSQRQRRRDVPDGAESPSRQLHAGVRSCKGNFFFRRFGRTRFSACCGVVSLSVLGPYRWCLSLALGAALAFFSSFRELFVRFLAGFFECATEKVGQARLTSLFRLQFGLFLNRGGVVGLTYVPSRRILLFPS